MMRRGMMDIMSTCQLDFLVLQIIARLGEGLETKRSADHDEHE